MFSIYDILWYTAIWKKKLFCSNIFIKNSHFHLVSTMTYEFSATILFGSDIIIETRTRFKVDTAIKKRWRIIVLFKSQRSSIRCISQEHTIFAVLRSIRLHSFPRSTIFTEIYHRIDRKNSKNYFIISIRKQVIGQSYDKTNCSMLLAY